MPHEFYAYADQQFCCSGLAGNETRLMPFLPSPNGGDAEGAVAGRYQATQRHCRNRMHDFLPIRGRVGIDPDVPYDVQIGEPCKIQLSLFRWGWVT